HKDVANLEWMRTFNINLHFGIRSEGADDDVGRYALELGRIHLLPSCHFPKQAVIEAQLLDLAIANAISPAIAHVRDPSAISLQEEGRARGSHALKFAILLAPIVNTGVGLGKSTFQRGFGAIHGMFVERVGNDGRG